MKHHYAYPLRCNPGTSKNNHSTNLFKPLKIKNLVLKNRVAVSPMCMYSSIDGSANEFQLVHLGQYALHGIGLVLTEATAVSPEGRITPRDAGIYLEGHVKPWKKICDFVHSLDSKIGIQLAHAGRKGSTYPPFVGRGHGAAVPVDQPDESENLRLGNSCRGYKVKAPSPLKWNSELALPIEMSLEDIQKTIDDFQKAAIRADESEFDVIEIHAAHGYLIHQFLSPLSNKRTDDYGGSFYNRCLLLKSICREVRKVWKEKPLFVRFSCTDWIDGGWSLEDTVKLVAELYAEGLCDLADCSGGGLGPDQRIPPLKPGYQLEFSETIKKEVSGILTGTVGGYTDAKHVEQVLTEKKADMVFLGRELLRNPSWLFKAGLELGCDVEKISQYRRSSEKSKI